MATTRRPGGTPTNPRRAASPRAGGSASARPPATRPTVATRPAASRPAASARGSRPSQERRTPRSVKRLAILASIIVMLAITLIPALRSTFSQQSEIDGLQDRIAQQRDKVAALEQEQRRWADPAYVEQQARQRLKFVRAGEKSFTVIDPDSASEVTGGARIASPAPAAAANVPWYGELWQSMVVADTPSRAATGAPSPVPPAP